MRREFSESTKRILAARVAHRCSCPGCNRITVGPGNAKTDQVINLGEAAHIYAASNTGPRGNSSLSDEQIASIDNGIWLCRHHARIIDADQYEYSAETLQQWKELAEKAAYEKLTNLEGDEVLLPQTLISLNPQLIFSGTWLSVTEDTWRFSVSHFIEGDVGALRAYSIDFKDMKPWARFVAIESQGDGRQLQSISWQIGKQNALELTCQVLPKALRTDPEKCGGDFGLGEDMDLEIVDGDFTMITGIDAALQTMRVVLSSGFGDFISVPEEGSAFSRYYASYNNNPVLLNRLIKLEIIRLFSVETPDPLTQKHAAAFDFINRILDVDLVSTSVPENAVLLKLRLEWGNHKQWTGDLRIHPRNLSEERENSGDIEQMIRNLFDGNIGDGNFPFKLP